MITGIRDSIHDFSSGVGTGSREQDVGLELVMSMRTSSSVSNANDSKTEGASGSGIVPYGVYEAVPRSS